MARLQSRETFRLGLGHPVLDFLATLAGRHRTSLERLETPEDFSRWLSLSGVAPGISCSEEQLRDARELREAIYTLVDAARSGRRLQRRELELVNEWARQPRRVPQLDGRRGLHWEGPDPCVAALAELAGSAITLISGPDVTRIRNCAGPSCSLLFIDHSRPGARRWCSMRYCGNRAKTARYRSQQKQASP
jgi:predicted RNA-binding Zn ribbon-like protein